MNIDQMNIAFFQIIEDTSPNLFDKDRPDPYKVIEYLNHAISRYLSKKYMPFPDFRKNIQHLKNNTMDLREMIKEYNFFARKEYTISSELNYSENPTNRFGDGVNYKYNLPFDFYFPISAFGQIDRSNADVIVSTDSSSWVEFEFINHAQTERYIKNGFNKPIARKPKVLIEDDKIIHFFTDGQVDDFTGIRMQYLRKPWKLSYDFVRLGSTTAASYTINSSYANKYVRVLPGSILYYPVNSSSANLYGQPEGGFKPGDIFKIQTGYYTMYKHGEWAISVGYPIDETDTPCFADYTHEDIVRLAVQMYLDEAKFKLLTKQAQLEVNRQ